MDGKDVIRSTFVRCLLSGHCATVEEVYEEVSKLTGIPVDLVHLLMWGRQSEIPANRELPRQPEAS
jgi:hypothetical protein